MAAAKASTAPNDEPSPLWAWDELPPGRFVGGNQARLLRGGDELFPAMCEAIAAARSQVWLATYIFELDAAGRLLCDALSAVAQRGVQVCVVVDGFGARLSLPALRERLGPAVTVDVFRSLNRWWSWLQPQHLRRLHQKLCAVDDAVAFVGGINILDDRHDLVHGNLALPRLDFAVELRGPVAPLVQRMVHALSVRARFGRAWRQQVRQLARSERPVASTVRLLRGMRGAPPSGALPDDTLGSQLPPVPVAFVVRDNLRQRRAIERQYIAAMRRARRRIDITCPYFYPGRAFLRTLRAAAKRGVQVRLLLQGMADYRLAAMAAQVLYDDLLLRGVQIHEYTPSFLHAKVALVDDDWATVGSSNIDPLSLLLNLEANVVVRDAAFSAQLGAAFDDAVAQSRQVLPSARRAGWRHWATRNFVAWCSTVYLRLAGIDKRY
ncbi:MAG: cardiolipin synthase ClsB [Rubrivivax sp.]